MSKHPVRLMFFSGFYESIHNSAFDFEEECVLDDHPGKKWGDFRWTYDWNQYARNYVSAISSETGLKFEFRNLWSPREYNFATDEIYCFLDKKDVKKISSALETETLKKLIKERFTSCDGFISFYSNDIDEWKEKDVMEWDEIELGTLLDAWLEENDLYENLDYQGYDYCSGNGQYVDWEETEESKERTKEAEEFSELHQQELEKLEAWKKSVAGW